VAPDFAQIVIDDHGLRPSEASGMAGQVVLTALALMMMANLIHG
jgi:hypothetical protein